MEMNNKNRMPKLTIPVAVAGILRGDKILLLKRARQPFKGLWSLPGGKIKFGEFANEAIRREVKEETSIELAYAKYMGIVCERVLKDNSVVASHIIYVFSCEPQSENLISSEEGEARWFGRQEVLLHADDIIPTDFLIVKEMILNGSGGSYNCSVEQRGNKYKITEFVKVR